MVGDRDSEIAVIIEDTQKVNIYMNGQMYVGRKYAHELRKHLFKEHLGLLDTPDSGTYIPIYSI